MIILRIAAAVVLWAPASVAVAFWLLSVGDEVGA